MEFTITRNDINSYKIEEFDLSKQIHIKFNYKRYTNIEILGVEEKLYEQLIEYKNLSIILVLEDNNYLAKNCTVIYYNHFSRNIGLKLSIKDLIKLTIGDIRKNKLRKLNKFI